MDYAYSYQSPLLSSTKAALVLQRNRTALQVFTLASNVKKISQTQESNDLVVEEGGGGDTLFLYNYVVFFQNKDVFNFPQATPLPPL